MGGGNAQVMSAWAALSTQWPHLIRPGCLRIGGRTQLSVLGAGNDKGSTPVRALMCRGLILWLIVFAPLRQDGIAPWWLYYSACVLGYSCCSGISVICTCAGGIAAFTAFKCVYIHSFALCSRHLLGLAVV